MKEKRSFKGVWIPREIWLDKDLSIIEKCLLTEISSLDNENSCFASNKYFSEFFCIGERQISKYISRLQENGRIVVSIIGRNKRSITIEQKFYQGRNESSITDRTKVLHNNKDSNTDNNIRIPCEQSSPGIEKVIELFRELSPSLSYGNKTQRKACDEMIRRFGLDGTLQMSKRAIEAMNADRYCPRAITPYEFWQKIGAFKVYFSGNNNQESKLVVL